MAAARWQVGAVALVVAATTTQCAAPTEAPKPPPRIAVEPATVDFGTVEAGTPLTHLFSLHNAGGSDLRIDNVKSPCGCTTVMRPVGAIPPGGAASLQAKCEPTRALGPRMLTVTVYSNDPAQPMTALSLTSNVTADVAADPPEVYVGRVHRGERLDVPLRIVTGRGRPPVGLRLSNPDGAVLHASMPGPTPGESDRAVGLAIRSTAPLGRFAETVRVDTNNTRYPTVSAQVTGIVDGDLTPAPRELRFGAVARGEAAFREVLLRNHGETPARVVGAVVWPQIARAQIQTVEDGREYRVRVSLYGSLSAGRAQANLKVQTNRPEQPEILVPLSVTIREKK